MFLMLFVVPCFPFFLGHAALKAMLVLSQAHVEQNYLLNLIMVCLCSREPPHIFVREVNEG